MAAGHDHSDWVSADTTKLRRVMENRAVQAYRWSHFAQTNNDHDLPYLAGYSQDGNTIYFDRHLPEELCVVVDGTKWTFRPRNFVRLHEEWEKSTIEAMGLHYGAAHEIGNGAERRGVVAAGIPWTAYRQVLSPYIKADELERLESVPADLDMRPYNFPPVNRTLIKRMYAAMGQKKLSKTDPKVEYSDDGGRPSRHCGPDFNWPKGYCKMYCGDYACDTVEGYIAPHGLCKIWKAAK